MYMQIKLKRIYEPSDEQDGVRILVDRLWPRGLTKQDAKIDLWPKLLTPPMNYENGISMIWRIGMNSSNVIWLN